MRSFLQAGMRRSPESQVQVQHGTDDSNIRAGTQCEFARSSRVLGLDTSPVTESPEVMTPRRWA